jgi:large subunit ribosomal protein L10
MSAPPLTACRGKGTRTLTGSPRHPLGRRGSLCYRESPCAAARGFFDWLPSRAIAPIERAPMPWVVARLPVRRKEGELMPTAEKVAVVERLAEQLRRARLAVITDYRGLTVRDLATLRRQLRPLHVDYTVAKNTLLRIAARNSGIAGAEPLLEGPTAVAFCYDEIVGPAKALSDFARTSRILAIRGGILEGRVIGAEEVSRLATLPPMEQLRAELVGAIGGPLAQLVGVLNGVLQTLVGTLEARHEQLASAPAA